MGCGQQPGLKCGDPWKSSLDLFQMSSSGFAWVARMFVMTLQGSCNIFVQLWPPCGL